MESLITLMLQIYTDFSNYKASCLQGALLQRRKHIIANFLMMQISSNKIEDFSLIGKWINEITTDAKPSIELSFYNNQKVIIRLNPGNEFQLDYFIESKFDYNILRFADEVTGEIEFSVFLYKVIDEKTLKVQLIDKDDIPEWDNKAPEINIGFLYRKETN